MSGLPYPKTTRRPRAQRPLWSQEKGAAVVRARAGGLCEAGIPDVCTIHADEYRGEFSHRLSRKQGGSWAPSNGVRACSACHRWIEGEYLLAVVHGLRVPSHADPARTPVYLRLQPWWHGWWLLGDDGVYDSAWALECALALGLPEVPHIPGRKTAA